MSCVGPGHTRTPPGAVELAARPGGGGSGGRTAAIAPTGLSPVEARRRKGAKRFGCPLLNERGAATQDARDTATAAPHDLRPRDGADSYSTTNSWSSK